MKLKDKNILITGGAHRIGRYLSLAAASEGANVIIHYNHSIEEAKKTKLDIETFGVQSHLIQYDFSDLAKIKNVIREAELFGPLYALINNAAIFEPINWENCIIEDWNKHININLTAPFFLCQEFAKKIPNHKEGRILNILDWRALRPGSSHLPYTISKAALAALTKSLASSLAPQITVNGIALGAILPPADGGPIKDIINNIPAKRWAFKEEIEATAIFLLSGPAYITGEIIHVDGGRHLL